MPEPNWLHMTDSTKRSPSRREQKQPGVFGGWDAPYTDDMPEIPTPVGEMCVYCREPIQDGEAGATTPSMGIHHRECSLRSVMGGIGHYVDHAKYCKGELGPDAGLTLRHSAVLVWAVYQGVKVSEDTLIGARLAVAEMRTEEQ